jgi:predicted anti-sigma-YlaC factor YlaD
MKLNHHRAGHLLSPYLDGELLPAESAAVQEHLLECAGCREVYDRLRATKALLGELPVADPPAEFWATVRTPWAARPSLATPVRAPWALWPGRLAWPVLRRPGLGRRIAWGVAAAVTVLALASAPVIKGTMDRLHAAEIGVDLYVREHARQMTTGPLTDRAYVSLVAGDADLVLASGPPRLQEAAP